MSLAPEDVARERLRQARVYHPERHDDLLTQNDWAALILRYTAKSLEEPFNRAAFRLRMVQVAALAEAAVESFDRGGIRDAAQLGRG